MKRCKIQTCGLYTKAPEAGSICQEVPLRDWEKWKYGGGPVMTFVSNHQWERKSPVLCGDWAWARSRCQGKRRKVLCPREWTDLRKHIFQKGRKGIGMKWLCPSVTGGVGYKLISWISCMGFPPDGNVGKLTGCLANLWPWVVGVSNTFLQILPLPLPGGDCKGAVCVALCT